MRRGVGAQLSEAPQRQGPVRIMATYVDILKSEFPEIDTEVFDYITGKARSAGPLSAGPRKSARFGRAARSVGAD